MSTNERDYSRSRTAARSSWACPFDCAQLPWKVAFTLTFRQLLS
jgi:hypothetical protein